jgi:hypothetical protein
MRKKPELAYGWFKMNGWRPNSVDSDEEKRVDQYRARFLAGPVGVWYTSLGGGFEITHGCNIRFAPNGTGSYHWWGGPPDDPEGKAEFVWRSVGDCCIAVSSSEEPQEQVVAFDFFVRRNEYEIIEVCIFQPDHWGVELFGEVGFWVSAHPLVHSVPLPKRPWWRIW